MQHAYVQELSFYQVHTGERLIGSAMELRINASEIGTGWEEKRFVYMSDPARGLEEAYEELSEKLREYGVKDGYVSVLQKRDKHLKSFAEVDIFVFNSTSGHLLTVQNLNNCLLLLSHWKRFRNRMNSKHHNNSKDILCDAMPLAMLPNTVDRK